jgi:hypothetical protein
MDLVKDEPLRYQIQKDSDGDQISHGCEGMPEYLSSMLSIKRGRAQKSRNFRLGVLRAVWHAEQDRNDRLNDEPQAAWA